ncbi:MAG: twin-arginine translocase TatA/TatE family subunit [Oligoflexales bacterium]|nr:twin-arginine translocase TatA/TatE family subunit [Oligoflexales bacterium]
MPSSGELLVIFGVAVLLFGPSKLPQLGSAIGESIKNFKKGIKPDEGSSQSQSTEKTAISSPALSQPSDKASS